MQSFLPLPTPFGLLLGVSILVIHVTLVFTLNLRDMGLIRIELVIIFTLILNIELKPFITVSFKEMSSS